MRTRGRTLALLGASAAMAGACVWGGGRAPDPELRGVWEQYRELPEQRALAIAGDLRSKRWVAGVTGGHETRIEAEVAALRACAERRNRRRITSPCRIYAVGDEVLQPAR